MRSDEELRRALARPDLPWPDETGAYERFLRRRARHARTLRGVTVLTLTLAVAAAVVGGGPTGARSWPRTAARATTAASTTTRASPVAAAITRSRRTRRRRNRS